MERREFLTIIGKSVLALGTAQLLGGIHEVHVKGEWDDVWKVEWDSNPDISFREASALAIQFDKAFDMLPKEVPVATPEMLKNILDEVVPLFALEGFVETARYPTDAEFAYFDGTAHEGVSGRSDCESSIRINERMENPFSSWYNSSFFLSTVVHETAHINQTKEICDRKDDKEVEATAQIMAIEVLSHLACKGNEMAFYSVVTELRDMAVSTAYAAALEANHLEWFNELTLQLSPGAMAQSRIQANERRFENDQWGLSDNLKNYSVYPLQRMIDATHNRGIIEDLALPPQYNALDNFSYIPAVVLDDMQYLIQHLMSMAQDIQQQHR